MRFFIGFFFLSSILTAQVHAQKFKGLVTLGINTSQIDGDGLSGYYKSGLMLGAGVAIQLHERWSMNVSVEYMGKGSRTAFRDSVNYFKWKMQYIDIPLALSLKVHERFSFQLGLTPSVLVNDKVDGGFGYTASVPKNDPLNLLIAPGFEYFPVKNISFLARYQYSLIRFNSSVSNATAKFHNLISIGLRFYLKSAEE